MIKMCFSSIQVQSSPNAPWLEGRLHHPTRCLLCRDDGGTGSWTLRQTYNTGKAQAHSGDFLLSPPGLRRKSGARGARVGHSHREWLLCHSCPYNLWVLAHPRSGAGSPQAQAYSHSHTSVESWRHPALKLPHHSSWRQRLWPPVFPADTSRFCINMGCTWPAGLPFCM